jgi:hypothetical protein
MWLLFEVGVIVGSFYTRKADEIPSEPESDSDEDTKTESDK